MSKLTPFMLVVLVFTVSSLLAQQKTRYVDPSVPADDIYKHYSGTMASRLIALDLRFGFNGGSNYGGSTWYAPGTDGRTLFFIKNPGDNGRGAELSATEENPVDSLNKSYADELKDQWTFTIEGDKLTGTWYSALGSRSYAIQLTEDYSSSMQMNIVRFKDTLGSADGRGNRDISVCDFCLVVPVMSSAEGDFVTASIMKFLGLLGIPADLKQLRKELSGIYLSEFSERKYNKRLNSAGEKSSWPDRDIDVDVLPVYNDNGILVLHKSIFYANQLDFYPRAVDRYLCIDFREKREWHYTDIFNADKAVLSKMLERAFRKKFRLDAGKPLKTWFVTDTIPVTENVMIAHDGIYFTYQEDEIYRTADVFTRANEMTVMLTYAELANILTPVFKKRMAL